MKRNKLFETYKSKEIAEALVVPGGLLLNVKRKLSPTWLLRVRRFRQGLQIMIG